MNLHEQRTADRRVARNALIVGSAVVAAGTALWVRHKARQAERDNPPVGRFIEVDGVRLHYVERGEGPPIVLFHGNAVLLQDFIASGLLDALAARHRVIAFDRPGYGFSQRPRDRLWTPAAQAALFEQALVRLGAVRPVVLGHSWGTLVALALAQDYPERVAGLVLVSGYYYPTARLDVALVAPVALPVLGDVMRYTVSPVFGRLSFGKVVQTMFSPCPVPPQFGDILSREMMLRPSQIRANAEDAAFMIPGAARNASRYADLRLPISILAGADDLVVDVGEHSVRLHDEVPQSRLRVVPDTGHMVHYEALDDVVGACADVAASSAPVSRASLQSS